MISAAVARFVVDYWRGHLVERSRKLHAAGSHEAATGTGIGAHALCMVLAALDGETDPDQLGIGDDGRDELAKFSAAPTHAVDAPVRGDGADPPEVPVTPTGDDEGGTT